MRVRKGSVRVWLWAVVAVIVAGLLWVMSRPMDGYPGPAVKKASEIISNLRSPKTALLELYVDCLDSVDQQGRIDGQTIEDFVESDGGRKITDYMKRPVQFTIRGANAQEGEYLVASDPESGSWFIGYRLEGRTNKDKRTRERLAERGESVGLLKYAKKDSPKYDTFGEDTGYVWLLVR